ncbi:MAG: hypothetical protein FWD16_04155 [Clostridia bacterium]|nr:hypothetical protein [Clostridia bacterium]
MSTNVDFRNPVLIRQAGLAALQKELGPVGTTYFLRQFSPGYGDYTAERDELLKHATFEEIAESVRILDVKAKRTEE